ncbi:MAG: helix-turn-helix domain-containing protein, partial [Chlorobi bacterium]|nr:helix-turn-helix domain-containing protein [Chlorobiota bacterium]
MTTDRIEVRRPSKFFMVENAALSIITEIGRTAFCLYCALLRYANQQGECFPTVKRLASDIGCSVRTVQYELRKLEEAGYLRVTEVIDAPSIYHVHDPSERERQSSAANDNNNNSGMSEIAPPGANDCTPLVQPIAPPTVTSPSSTLLSPLSSPSVPSPAPPSLTPPSYPPIIPPPSPPMRNEPDPRNSPPPSPPPPGGEGGGPFPGPGSFRIGGGGGGGVGGGGG